MNKKLKLWELNRLTKEAFIVKDKAPIVVILDELRSFENVGSIFRTSDAFCVHQLALCGITPVPPHREIHRTALGATESVSWRYFEKTMDAVIYYKQLGYQVYAVEQAEQTILLNAIKGMEISKIAVIFGNEVNGVNQSVIDACDGVIEIPQFGTKHSLNVSVCAGIVLWECSKRLNPALQEESYL